MFANKRKVQNEKFDETLTKKTVEVYVKLNIQVNNVTEQHFVDSLEIPTILKILGNIHW